MNSKTGVTFSIVAIAAVVVLFATGPLATKALAFPGHGFGGFHRGFGFGFHRHFGFGFHRHFGFGFHRGFGFGGFGGFGGGCGGSVAAVAAVAASEKHKSTNVKAHEHPLLFFVAQSLTICIQK